MKLLEGTPQEIAEYQRISGQVPTAQRSVGTANGSGSGSPHIWNEETANAFWNSLDRHNNGGRQKKLLCFMIKHEGRATAGELLKQLKIDTTVLRGLLANLTRNARRETGYNKALAVEWATDKGGYYYIPEALFDLLKQLE